MDKFNLFVNKKAVPPAIDPQRKINQNINVNQINRQQPLQDEFHVLYQQQQQKTQQQQPTEQDLFPRHNSIDNTIFCKNNPPKQGDNVYKRAETLGSGSFGSVIAAHDQNNVKYAVKLLDIKSYTQYSGATKYITGEFQILMKLQEYQHPYLVNLHEVLDICTYIIEYCNRNALDQYINTNPYLSEGVLKIIFSQMVSALSFLHGLDIVHRDIKLQNVLVHEKDGKIIFKLSDFGFSKLTSQQENLMSRVGTKLYMAPEMAKGQYDKRIDIYALGVMFYMMAKSKNVVITEQIRNDQVDKLEFVSNEFKLLIKRMIEKDYNRRITLQEIIDGDWMMSRIVPLDFFSSPLDQRFRPLSLTVRDLYDLSDERYTLLEHKFGVQLKDKLLFVTYMDSNDLLPFPKGKDNICSPLYTIEKVYCFDINHIYTLQLPAYRTLTKYDAKLVMELKDYGDHQGITDQLKEEYNKIQDIGSIINVVGDILTRANEYSQVYNALRKYYNSKIQSGEFKKIITKLKEYSEHYKPNSKLYDQIKEFKYFDLNGNETNQLLIDRLPVFVKGFLNNDMNSIYNEYTSNINIFKDTKKYFEDVHKLLIQSYEDLEKIQTLQESVKKLLEVTHRSIDPLSSFCSIFNSEKLFKDSNQAFNDTYKIYERLCIALNPDLKTINNHLCHAFRLMNSLEMMIKIPADRIESTNLMGEIAKIPSYYESYKNEIKRRSQFNQSFAQHREKMSLEFHSLLKIEREQQSSFDTVDRPQNFVVQDTFVFGDFLLDNPLARYLPQGEMLNVNELIINEGFVNISENDIIAQLSIDKMDLLRRNESLFNENQHLKKSSIIQQQQNSDINNAADGDIQSTKTEIHLNQNNNNQSEMNKMMTDIQSLRDQMEQLKIERDQEAIGHRKEIATLRVVNMDLDRHRAEMEKYADTLESDVETAIKQRDDLQKELRLIQEAHEIDQKEREHNFKINNDFKSSEYKKLAKERDEYSKQLANAIEKLTEQSHTTETLQRTIEEQQRTIDNLNTEIGDLEFVNKMVHEDGQHQHQK